MNLFWSKFFAFFFQFGGPNIYKIWYCYYAAFSGTRWRRRKNYRKPFIIQDLSFTLEAFRNVLFFLTIGNYLGDNNYFVSILSSIRSILTDWSLVCKERQRYYWWILARIWKVINIFCSLHNYGWSFKIYSYSLREFFLKKL